MAKLKRPDLIHPELSYKIVGCAFEVFNQLGFGHAEKIYQKALAAEFRHCGLPFAEQVYAPVHFKGELMGKMFLDFLVEDKVIVEIKKSARFSKRNFDQVNQYLAARNLELALLIHFTREGVVCKRVLNIR